MNWVKQLILRLTFVRVELKRAYEEGRRAEQVPFLGGCPKCGR